mgnify:CR=1 FL=1
MKLEKSERKRKQERAGTEGQKSECLRMKEYVGLIKFGRDGFGDGTKDRGVGLGKFERN